MIAKPYLRLALVAFFFLSTHAAVQAQNRQAPTIAREGFWVVEWMPKNRSCIVRFYNDQRQLVYEETMDRRLNIVRRQTRQNLSVALDQAMYVWNATHKVPTERQWVAVQFDRK
jgi:hypothetical protein